MEEEIQHLRHELNAGQRRAAYRAVHKGFLRKGSRHLHIFSSRYVVLTTSGLYSFKSEALASDLANATVTFPFAQEETVVDVKAGGTAFVVKRGQKWIEFRCETTQSCR